MKQKILVGIFALLSAFTTIHAERQICYAVQGQEVKFNITWTSENYGKLQWEQSTDNGETWTAIKDATKPSFSYIMKNDSPSLYRVVIEGDPSCPAITEVREVRLVDISGRVAESGSDYINITVSAPLLVDVDLAEYGYAVSLGGLNRPHTLIERVKVGDSLPGEQFVMTCAGLLPGTSYSLRPYFKTADGSVLFGAAKSAKTKDGIAFDSEDWIIEKNTVQIPFSSTTELSEEPELWFGADKSSLEKCDIKALGNNKYCSQNLKNLTPGTTYLAVVKARIGEDVFEIEKNVTTWSDYSTFEVDKTVKPVTHGIDWDNTNLICLTPDKLQVEYPRMCRVDENKILLAYHGGENDAWHNCYLSKSYDNGRTWTDAEEIFNKTNTFLGSGYWRIVNPEMTRLANGWVILTCVANANPETNFNCKVLATISKDGGESWSDPIVVGRGRTWEPQVVQLPNGELELLVSSEATWWEQGGALNQEIVSTRSTDNGLTWTQYKRASYKAGARDGMPVAVVMQGNKGVVFIEESVNGGIPPTIQHRDLDKEWDTLAWNAQDDKDRWRTGFKTGAGAPYMIQLPTGEFLIMAHSDQTGAVWQTSRPQTALTDNSGHGFYYFKTPLSGNVLPAQCGAYYNSFFLYDDTTVWLLFTKAQYDGDRRVESDIMILPGKIVEM
ncbi:MAG: exo-alpha-sialidase [Muribaculaceae bacterium]|nr:exo-alpha-sialidase [Muribaculaceae bacterium]